MNDSPLEQLRVPPMSIESEQAVLGGLLLPYSNAYDLVADILTADDFYRHDHQLIFRAIGEMAGKNRPYDAVTALEWFDAHNLSEHVGGGAYLIELSSTTPSAANILAYARIVKDKAVLRKLIDVGTSIVNNAFLPDGRDTTDLLDQAESQVLGIAGSSMDAAVQSGDDGLRATLVELSKRRKMAPNQLLGVTTSLDGVDELTHGLQPSDLIILAARPSMGKTALALQIRRAAALNGKRPYLIELEMTAPQVYMRDISATGRVDFNVVQRTARASEFDMMRMKEAVNRLRGLDWWLDTASGLSIDTIVSRIRRMKKQHDIGIAIIDYLQYVDMTKQLRNLNVTNAVQEVTRRLKACAKELNIPVVLLSQLNRANEKRTDKRPMMSDLRESGAIEQDADQIIFIHREGYYNQREWARDDARHKLAEIIVAKSRNGIVDTCTVEWDGRVQTFSNLSYDAPANIWNPQQVSSKGGFEPVQMHGMVQPIKVSQEDED